MLLGGEHWLHSYSLVESRPEQFLVIEADGEIQGALRITPAWMQVGSCRMLKGDVGEVGVRPDVQGRGLGTRLMRAAVEHMRAKGFHFSRLGGLVEFYSRFGYRAFPRGLYEFAIEPMQGGNRLLTIYEALRLPEELAGHVRRYDPARDWHACQRLRQQFNTGRTGAPVADYDPSSPAPAANVDPRGFSFVFDDGQVRGYVLASRQAEGQIITPCEARVVAGDGAFDPGRPETLWAPLKALLLEAARINSQRVAARLPFDPMVEYALRDGRVLYRRVELQGGPASNMVRIVNLPALLEALVPELQSRWDRSRMPWQGSLALAVDDERAAIQVADGRVSVALEPGPAAGVAQVVEMPTFAFMALLLGLRSWGELEALCRHHLTPPAARSLGLLFPPQPTATGLWG